MKKVFKFLLRKVLKKVINKSVSDVVINSDVNPEMPVMEPIIIPGDNSKKALWKFIIQTLINILAAVLTALGTTSCVRYLV